jgi:ABC-type sugar transport system ATPase subunit
MTAALSLRQIKKSYGAVEALKGVDLDVPQGKVMAICGDNGAGKSHADPHHLRRAGAQRRARSA